MRRLAISNAEAKRREVFRTAGLCIVSAWVLLQVAAPAPDALELSSGLLRYAWIGAFPGLLPVRVLGRYYDVTAGGIRKTPPAAHEPGDLTLRVPDYVIIAALAMVVGIGAMRPGNYWLASRRCRVT